MDEHKSKQAAAAAKKAEERLAKIEWINCAGTKLALEDLKRREEGLLEVMLKHNAAGDLQKVSNTVAELKQLRLLKAFLTTVE